MANNITYDELTRRLSYNPSTGVFTWVRRVASHVPSGATAGCVDGRGYVQIMLDGVNYKAHRLAWLYTYKIWPVNLLDHINGDRTDNRIANLREATSMENTRHGKGKSRSGLPKGVEQHKRGIKRFQAKIMVAGKRISLGYYFTLEEAHEAYVSAAKRYHGEFFHP